MMEQITPHVDAVAPDAAPGQATLDVAERTVRPVWAFGVFALVSIVRFLYSVNRTVFSTFPDEPAQLAIGRWFGGGTVWSLLDHSTWQPGYSVLLVPAYWVTDSPELVYRYALVVSSLLGGVAAVLLARLLVRLTPADGRTAALTAIVIALLPAGLASSARAWAEPLITVIVLALLLVMVRAVRAGSAPLAAPGVLLAGAGYLVHGRLLPLVPASLCVFALVLHRRGRPVLIVAAAMGTAAMFLLIEWFSTWVHRTVWTEPDQTNTAGSTLERLTRPAALFDSVVGQSWYVLVASALFGGIGIWVLVRSATGSTADAAFCRRSDALVVLGLIAPLVAVSMLFMAGRHRPDMLIYGRYNEAVLWPVLGIGVVWTRLALRAGRRAELVRRFAGTAAVTVVLTVLVAIRSGDALRGPGVSRLMISGVAVLADPESTAFLWLACGLSLGIAALAVLALVQADRAPLVAALLIVAVVVGLGVRSWAILGRNLNSFADVANVREVTDLLPPNEPIGFHFVPIDEPSLVRFGTQRRLVQLYQMYLPDHRFAVDEGFDDDVGPYVFAPSGHQPFVESDAEVVWFDERSGMALWREP